MKKIRSVDVGTLSIYSALLVGFWTLVFGVAYWTLGWLFGARSWWIDMNLGSWSVYTLSTLVYVIAKAIIAGLVGALAGVIGAVVYNLVARQMGGVKIYLQ
jgi:hypothetical protein